MRQHGWRLALDPRLCFFPLSQTTAAVMTSYLPGNMKQSSLLPSPGCPATLQLWRSCDLN